MKQKKEEFTDLEERGSKEEVHKVRRRRRRRRKLEEKRERPPVLTTRGDAELSLLLLPVLEPRIPRPL